MILIMKCPNCGYENSPEDTKDNKCDQCGYLLIQTESSLSEDNLIKSINKTNDLVVIATFNDSISATLAQDLLEEQGIKSWLLDEEIVNVAWYLTTAVNGIKLVVTKELAELAFNIIQEYESSLNEEIIEDVTEPVDVPSPSITETIIKQAWRNAVIGLIIIPLQLYSLWLLFSLFWQNSPLTSSQKYQVLIIFGLDLACLIIIWSIITSIA
jgi:hypothetical protein